MIDLRLGDCLDIMRGMDTESVDAVVTDPPAGISFMGKSWDSDKGGRDNWIAWMSEIAAECLRVLKPGGYALVWSLPRTSHWTGMAWENGGFEPRDRIAYCFGSGFPKSANISKQLDKQAGAKREGAIIGGHMGYATSAGDGSNENELGTSVPHSVNKGAYTNGIPATDAVREWAGWGTALKPAIEDWWVFRKPLSEATVAANVLRWGTGALNIDASRVSGEPTHGSGANMSNDVYGQYKNERVGVPNLVNNQGRFPANLITDGSAEVVAMFPQTTQNGYRKNPSTNKTTWFGARDGSHIEGERGFDDTGSAARFFKSCPLDEDDYPPLYYCAKASKAERDAGCEGLEKKLKPAFEGDTRPCHSDGSSQLNNSGVSAMHRNHHPTVKPLSMMRYLVTLCTREGATVLDPFMGSGTTGVACVQLGRDFIGCDNVAEYVEIAKRRIEAAQPIAIALPLMAEA